MKSLLFSLRSSLPWVVTARRRNASAPNPRPGSLRWSLSKYPAKQYDYYQPWTRKTSRVQKSRYCFGGATDSHDCGRVIRPHPGAIAKGWPRALVRGEVTWIDYYANLALVTTVRGDFWRGLKPASFAGNVPEEGSLQILQVARRQPGKPQS